MGLRKERVNKAGRRKVSVRGGIGRGKDTGGFDQNVPYMCMKFSNNQTIINQKLQKEDMELEWESWAEGKG